MSASENLNMDLQQIRGQAKSASDTVKQYANDYIEQCKFEKTYDELAKEYRYRTLNFIVNPINPEPAENEVLDKVNTFYFNMKICDRLIDYATEYTETHKDQIEHSEEIEISSIIKNLKEIKNEVDNNINEIKSLIINQTIIDPTVNFVDDNVEDRRIRDFLIIKFVIEKLSEGYNLLMNN